MSWRVIGCWMLFQLAVGCTSPPPEIRFESASPPLSDDPHPNRDHVPLVTLEDFQRFDREAFDLVSKEGAGSSTTGAHKILIRLHEDGRTVPLKEKTFPPFLDGLNNSPRKELAAFAVQRFFLDPIDYVVPTFGVRCIPLEDWKKNDSGLPTRISGTNCVLVSYAFWLRDVTLPDPLFDAERFASEPRYAYHLANFNILTYLVDHHDNRKGNFLVSENDQDRRVFAIDNGTTFGPILFNWFYPPSFSWRKIKVPALPRKTVDRLRRLTKDDLASLAVIMQLEADSDGILRIEKPGDPIDEKEGVSVSGTTIQLGLTEDEIKDVWERIEELVEDIDDGKIGVF